MSKFKVGDLVRSPNNYEGVVFAVTFECDQEYVYYTETKNLWHIKPNGSHTGQTHKEKARTLTLVNKPKYCVSNTACQCSETEARLDRLMDYLGVEEVYTPAQTSIQKLPQQDTPRPLAKKKSSKIATSDPKRKANT